MNKFEKAAFIHYTQSGSGLDPFNPRIEDIRITDIARGLSNESRYNGQTFFHYSVGQHSIILSYACKEENALYALLHDASEAYLKDLPKPLKMKPEMQPYRDAEKVLQSLIYRKYDLDPEGEPDEIKWMDRAIWGNEIPILFPGQKCVHDEVVPGVNIFKSNPDLIYTEFLRRFESLTGVKSSES